jgi:hypothetical protein
VVAPTQILFSFHLILEELEAQKQAAAAHIGSDI